MNRLETELSAVFGERLKIGQPLSELTSFGIGGPADLLITVERDEELTAAMATANRHGVNAFCLGKGTNLLVSDKGMRGLVVHLGAGFAEIVIDGSKVQAGAAASVGVLVEKTIAQGLAGLEFAEGIPGTVGGGLVMNAGAFGGEMARVVTTVHGVTAQGVRRALDNAELNFSYRRSELPPRFVISRVDFLLQPGDRTALAERANVFKTRRAARQPATMRNAGSVFKNPPGNFAGRLLEGAGLKGMRIGGAAFSERHANFIVNLGDARAADVRALMDLARARVKEQSGVCLEPEVRLVGEW